MVEPPLLTVAVAAIVNALVIGFLKTSIGGGIGIVVTPLLTLVLPPRTVLGLTVVQLNLANPITLRYYWGLWEPRQVRLLLPAVLLGIVGGGVALARLSDLTLRRLIGIAALVGAATQLGLLARRWRPDPGGPFPGQHRPGHDRRPGRASTAFAVGLAGGLASVVANSGGLLVGPYLAGLGLSNAAVVGTGAAVVTVADVVKLATYGQIGFLGWPLLAASVASFPALALGAWLGVRLNRRLPRIALALSLIGIAVAGSLRLLLS